MEQYIMKVRKEDLVKAKEMERSGKIKVIRVGENDFYVAAEEEDGDRVISIWPVGWGWGGKRDGWVIFLGKTNSFLNNIVYLMDVVKELGSFKEEGIVQVVDDEVKVFEKDGKFITENELKLHEKIDNGQYYVAHDEFINKDNHGK